nr:hypothetical protein [Tanacetum cinerariifolium]GEZ90523.1 hypothetical protein [Tanacetum cinerariifolium]
MSDASSAVTYTSIYMDSEPWRYYGEDSAEIGPPRVIVYEYDGIPIQPVSPPSPDYVPGPEHPPSPEYMPGPEHPPSPAEIPYVPKPKYPEYLAPSDDEAPLKNQPLPTDASPISASPDYVANSDLKEDPNEDLEDDQADYSADGGDGDDEPSDDDDDDDTNDEDPKEEPFKEDNEEEEEHLALADSSAVPIVDHVLPAGETEALEANEPTHAPGSLITSMEACIARHAALPSPPLLVPSLPLPLPSPLTTSLTDTGAPLGYRVAEIWMRALLPFTSRTTDIPEADMPPRKRACLTTPALGFEIEESSTAGTVRQPGPTESELRRCRVEQVCYGITDMWDEIVDNLIEIARPPWRGSSAIIAHVRTLKTHVAALITQTTALQTQLTTSLGRIEILEARDPEPKEDQLRLAAAVKFASCTLQGSALTWWNSYMRVVGPDVSYVMPWAALKRMIITKVERYIGGLLDMIHGSVKASKPQSMHEAIEFATKLMDKKMLTHAERQAEQKRKLDDTSRNNQHQQQPFKKNNGHYKNDCPKLKNGNQVNRAGKENDVARAYAVGTAGTNPNSNVVTGTFLLNNRYDSVLFDTGADRSFISTAFSSLIDIIPTTLDHGYDVKLAYEMGSFDVIIGMDWLVKYHAAIVYDEKLVRVPFGDKI